MLSNDDINNYYKQLYPDRNLKDLQLKIINNLLKGKDVIALLATGYGKSICYQLPFIITKKCVIVISPLIALMEDQMISLNKVNISTICFNSNLTNQLKDVEKMELIDCDVNKMIYMTPEFAVKESGFIKELYDLDKLCLVAIDEAHCISQWGMEFRKDYKSLYFFKDIMPNLPIYACTATATPKVCNDIASSLKLNKPVFIKSSFDRKNLYIECNNKTDTESDLLPYLTEFRDDFIIIYVKTRDDTERISKIVNSLDISSEAYHGGMNAKKRKEIHNKFATGIIKCIIATIAFGMGIDQNIHLVIHYGLPSEMESYYQEIGRAGRDGIESKCILFWDKKDIVISKMLLKDIVDVNYKKFREQQINIMEKWTHTKECRKKLILGHFGEIINKCMKCDNCNIKKKKEVKKIDYTPLYYPSYLIIKCFFKIKGTGFGSIKLINILKGSKSKNIEDQHNNTMYSLGKEYDVNFLKELIKVLIHNEYLGEQMLTGKGMIGSILISTQKSLDMWNIIKKKVITKENSKELDFQFNEVPKIYTLVNNYISNKEIQYKHIDVASQLDEIFNGEYSHIGGLQSEC